MSIIDKFTSQRYCTRISEVERIEGLFDLSLHKKLKDFDPPSISIHDTNVTIADPFLFVKNETLYLFFEEQMSYNGKGVIRMSSTYNLINWTEPITVLEEDYHISFPFVIKDGNDVYMIPETCRDSSIKLYKGNNKLTEWTYIKTLIEGKNYVDSSVIFHNGLYFLFAPIQLPDDSYLLTLHFSNSLLGNWNEHPASPIASGIDVGRNGGTVFTSQEVLYRPVQIASVIYGGNLSIYRIEKLTDKEYEETPISENIIEPKSWWTIGGHHFNLVYFKGKIIVANDFLKKTISLKDIIFRLKTKYYSTHK